MSEYAFRHADRVRRLIGKLLDLLKGAAVKRDAELLERFQLTEVARRPVATYSGGLRRRLDLPRAWPGRRSTP